MDMKKYKYQIKRGKTVYRDNTVIGLIRSLWWGRFSDFSIKERKSK